MLGRFFGVRYFLHVSLSFSSTARELSVRIPITIIDPNSLSIPSNLIAEVATAVEEVTRGRKPPSEAPEEPVEKASKAIRAENTKIDVKRPHTPEKPVQESWAWTPPRSPRLSLIPSPLLPSIKSPHGSTAQAARQHQDKPPVPPKEDRTAKLRAIGRTEDVGSLTIRTNEPTMTPNDPVSSIDQSLPPELTQTDVSASRYSPEDMLRQTELRRSSVDVDPQTIASLMAEVEKSPRKLTARKSRPRGIFFHRDVGRLTLPVEPPQLPQAPVPTAPRTQSADTDIPRVDGEGGSLRHNPLSSALAEEASHENHGFFNYYMNSSPKQQRTRSTSRPASSRHRISRAHNRAKSRVVFIHTRPANRGPSMHLQNPSSLELGEEHRVLPLPVNPINDTEGLWETVNEDGELGGGPGPDLGEVHINPSTRYDSLLRVGQWDSGSPPQGDYDASNVF